MSAAEWIAILPLGVFLLAVLVVTVAALLSADRKRAELARSDESILEMEGVSVREKASGRASFDVRGSRGAAFGSYAAADSDSRSLTRRLTLMARASGGGAAFELSPEKGADRAAEAAGMVRRYRSGDPAFDAACFVDTDDEGFALSYFEAVRRAAALGLLEEGCASIQYDPEARVLMAVWPDFNLKDPGDRSFLVRQADRLLELALGLPSPSTAPAPQAAGDSAAAPRPCRPSKTS